MLRPFGDYTLLRRLGQGGMAEVFLARCDRVNCGPRIVVLKRVLPHIAQNRLLVELFLNEARIASKLASENIAQIYEAGRVQTWDYITMEFVPGADLARLQERCEHSPAQTLGLGGLTRLLLDVCRGLAVAHDAVDSTGEPLGLVHGDIHPHNVMLNFDGVAKIIDFGVAQATHAAPEASPRGTYAYMAPEQLRGRSFDQRADVFSVGALAWEMLAGKSLFRRDANYLTLRAVVEDDVPSLRELLGDPGARFDALLGRALAKDPDKRLGSCAELADELEQLAAELGWNPTAESLAGPLKQLFAAERAQVEQAISGSGGATMEDWLFELNAEVDISWLLSD